MIRATSLLVLLATALCWLPAVADAQSILAPPPRKFVAPGRLFSVELPEHWKIVLTDDPYTIQFVPQRGGDAYLWVRRIVVPRKAHPRQIALNALERRLNKMPGFKLLNRRDVHVGGHKGAATIATYAHQGNIQFPRAMEELYVVAGTEAFIFHFECFEPSAGTYAPELNKFYASFIPRPTGDAASPFATDPKSPFPEVDKVEF